MTSVEGSSYPSTMANEYRVDEWGRVILSPDAAFRLAWEGKDVWSNPVDASPIVDQFNTLCARWDKTEYTIQIPPQPTNTPEEEHAQRADTWLISEDIKSIDVRAFLVGLCQTDEQRARVDLEMDLFEERDLIPLLQLMMYLVDHFQQHGIVWGVGRGSSVASYCLFLIGVHKIDSLRFGLDIHEFLK